MFHGDGRMDGQTDITKLIVAFRYFSNAQKGTVVAVHAMEAYRGIRGVAPLIHDFGTGKR